MNRLLLAAIAASGAPVAVGTDVAAYCRDLSALEAHMDGLLADFGDPDPGYVGAYSCACAEPPGENGRLTIDCDERDANGLYYSSDQMQFELRRGEYVLSATLVGVKEDDGEGPIKTPDEVYRFEDGALVGCKANACASCEVCDDGVSVAMDCSEYPWWWNRTYACDVDDYVGSFANCFDFGAITGDGEAAEGEDTVPVDFTAVPSLSREQFCGHLAPLESILLADVEDLYKMTWTVGYQCSCGGYTGDDVSSFTVTCEMEGIDGPDSVTYEKMVFAFDDGAGAYVLAETSWFEGVGVGDPREEYTPNEKYAFEDGALRSCVSTWCTSCAVCDDGQSVEIDCGDAQLEGNVISMDFECSEGYTGSFSNDINFPAITKMAPTPTTVPAEDQDNVPTWGPTRDAAKAQSEDQEPGATLTTVPAEDQDDVPTWGPTRDAAKAQSEDQEPGAGDLPGLSDGTSLLPGALFLCSVGFVFSVSFA